MPLTRSFPHPFSNLPPQGSGAGRTAALGRPTNGRGRNLSWTHRARAPRSGAQDPPKETAARAVRAGTSGSSVCPGHRFRASCTARVFWEITGPGPGETDSDFSLRQNPAALWTRMEDPHVKAGEVVIRKTPGHSTIRRGRFIKSRPEQFLLHRSVKASSASTRSRNQTAARPWFPLQTLQTSHRQLFFRNMPVSTR